MVLATADTITHLDAASSAAAIHMHYEGEVVETPLHSFADDRSLDGVAVLAPTQGVVELFPADGQRIGALAGVADEAIAQGWAVGVIVPTPRLGEAHHELRGRSLRLQPWWVDGDRICFGGPEVP